MADKSENKELLGELLASADNLDAAMVMLFAERFKLTKKIIELKKSLNMAPGADEREASQLARLRGAATVAGLSPDLAQRFQRFIIGEALQQAAE